jgi:hypothetical protein
MGTSQALEKAQTAAVANRKEVLDLAASGVVREVAQLRTIFEKISEHAVILTPTLNIPALPQKTGVIVNAVVLDVKKVKKRVKDGFGANAGWKEIEVWTGDVYHDKNFCDDDEAALTKSGLLKLMAACGISEDPDRPLTLEVLGPYKWQSRCILIGRGIDGIWRRITVTKLVDLSDGAPDAVKPEWKGNRKTGNTVPIDATALANARRHGPMNCQTKAMLAAFRKFPGYAPKQKYPIADLLKPFVIPCLIPDLDMRDPEDRQLARMLAVGGSAALFPQIAPAAAPLPALPPAPQVLESSSTLGPGEDPDGDLPDAPPARPATPPKTTAKTSGPNAPPPAEPEDDPDDDTLQNASEDEEGADDVPDSPEPPPAPERHVCGCQCGHQREIEAPFAAMVLERMGAELCALCVPGRRFDIKAHQGIKRLRFPKKTWLEPIEAAIKHAKEQGAA